MRGVGVPKGSQPATSQVCTMAECSNPAARRGWCHKHYKRWQVHGDPTVVITQERTMCAVPDCDEHGRQKGYCSKHARRIKKFGSPYIASAFEYDSCSVVGCEGSIDRHQMCEHHAEWVESRGDGPIERKPRRRKCAYEGCENLSKNRGFCGMHDKRLREHGDPSVRLETPTLPDEEVDAFWREHGVIPSLRYSDLACAGSSPAQAKMPFVCMTCAMPGQAALNQVKSGKQQACGYCSDAQRLTPDTAISRMTRIGLMPRTEFSGSTHDHWPADCMICGEEVKAEGRPRLRLSSSPYGCFDCALKATAEKRKANNVRDCEALAEEIGYTLHRWWRRPDGETSMLWLELSCDQGHGSYPTRDSNLKRGNRCPFCAQGGIDQGLPTSLYVIASDDMLKVGISNTRNLTRRLNDHRRNGFPEVIQTNDFDDYDTARGLELTWIEYLKQFPDQTVGREYIAWHPDHLDFALNLIPSDELLFA